MLIPDDSRNENSFKVSTLFQPFVRNNEDTLQVFENDEQARILFLGSREEEKDASMEPKHELD